MKPIFILMISFCFLSPLIAQKHFPGEKAEGGLVFYVKKSHGLVVAEKDLGEMSWESGKKACNSLVLSGYDDWRLPSIEELAIIYYEIFEKKVVNFSTGYYWSRAENKGITSLAWCFDFTTGSEYNNHSKKNTKYIIAVRSY